MYWSLPMFSFNLKVWRHFGFIDFKNFGKISFVILIEFFISSCQCLHIFYNWQDMGALAIGLFMTAILINALVRILSVMKNQSEFVQFLVFIEDWYTEMEKGNDAIACMVLKYVPRRTQAISIVSFALGSIGGVVTLFIPLFLETRALPYDMHIPFCNSLESPIYEIVYAMQGLISMPFVLLTYIPFTNLFISWLVFGISLLQILRLKLEALPCVNDEEMLKQLKKLIKFHYKIMTYGQTMENLVSFVCLVELMLFTLMLCVLLASFLLLDNVMAKVGTCIYIFCILYSLFIPYWHANEFSLESLKVADAVYNINWTQSNTEVRKCILILMIRCQMSLKIRAGGIFPMTLKSFQALLNATYSYFTMLRGMMAK